MLQLTTLTITIPINSNNNKEEDRSTTMQQHREEHLPMIITVDIKTIGTKLKMPEQTLSSFPSL
jgi:hypothetical protein